MSRRSLAGLLLVACLLAMLVARKTSGPDRALQTQEGGDETKWDPPSPILSMDTASEGPTSPSAFAAFKIDGMI